jgi:desulfoferrodoxin (superoxide reductase-like protein)
MSDNKKNIIESNEAKEYWLKYFKENIRFKKISKEEFDSDLKVGIYSHYMTDSNGIIWVPVFEPETGYMKTMKLLNDKEKQAEVLGKEVIRLKKILDSFKP